MKHKVQRYLDHMRHKFPQEFRDNRHALAQSETKAEVKRILFGKMYGRWKANFKDGVGR